MNKLLKISAVILIVDLVLAVSSCSMFSALGKVFTRVQNGENPIDDSLTVKAVLFPVDENNESIPTTGKPTNIIEQKQVSNMNPGQSVELAFDNAILVGTKVKLYIGLRTKTTHKYYRSETVIEIQEGINLVDAMPDFEEISQAEANWWMRL